MFVLPVYSDSVPFLPPPSVSELKIFPPNSTAYLLSVYFCMRQQITGLLKMKKKSCRVGWGGVGDGEEGEVKEQECRWHLLSSQCVHLAVLNRLPAFCTSLKFSLLWRRVMLCTLGFLHHVHCALLKLVAEKTTVSGPCGEVGDSHWPLEVGIYLRKCFCPGVKSQDSEVPGNSRKSHMP